MRRARSLNAVWLAMVLIAGATARSESPDIPRLFAQLGPSFPSALAVGGAGGTLLASTDINGVHLYDLAQGREVRRLPHGELRAIAISPDGNLVASAGRSLMPQGTPSVRVWRATDGVLLNELVIPAEGAVRLIEAMAVSHDFTRSAISVDDRTLRLWTIGNDQAATIKTPATLHSLAYSPNNTLIAATRFSGGVEIRDAATGELLRVLPTQDRTTSASFDRTGRQLMAATGAFITVWDTQTWQPTHTVPTTTDAKQALFAPDGEHVLVLHGRLVERYRLSDSQVLGKYDTRALQPEAISLGENHTVLLIAGTQEIRKLSYPDLRPVPGFSRTADSSPRLSLGDSRIGPLLLVEYATHSVIWSFEQGEVLRDQEAFLLPFTAYSGSFGLSLRALGPDLIARDEQSDVARQLWALEEDTPLTALAIAPQGNLLATGLAGGHIHVRDAHNGAITLDIDLDHLPGANEGTGKTPPPPLFPALPTALSLNHAGTQLAAVVGRGPDDPILILDARTGKPVARLTGHPGSIVATAFSADGQWLASGDLDGQIVLHRISTGKKTLTLSGHSGRISGLAFDAAHHALVSSADDGLIKLWSLDDSGRELLSLAFMGRSDWLVVTPDGEFDGTASALRAMGWRLGSSNEVVPLDSLYNDFFSPLLFQETLASTASRGRKQRKLPRRDIASVLQLPGLRAMLNQSLASVRVREGRSVLCMPVKANVNVSLFADALPYSLEPNSGIARPDDPNCAMEYPLPEAQLYELTSTTPLMRPLDRAVAPDRPGRLSSVSGSTLHVQTIAVSEYARPLPSLPASPSSAAAVGTLFERNQRTGRSPFRDTRVWSPLVDDAATLHGIMRRLDEIAAAAEPDNVVLLLLSGHGRVPPGQEMYYFLPSGFVDSNPMQVRDAGLSTAMLADAVRRMPVGRIILVIDSCQSGGAVDSLLKIASAKTRLWQGARKPQASQQPSATYILAATTPWDAASQSLESGKTAFIEELTNALNAPGAHTIRGIAAQLKRSFEQRKHEGRDVSVHLIESAGADFPIAGR